MIGHLEAMRYWTSQDNTSVSQQKKIVMKDVNDCLTHTWINMHLSLRDMTIVNY